MGWYAVRKKVRGRWYNYRQTSWREGKKVRTKATYIGPYEGSWRQAKDEARRARQIAAPRTPAPPVITTDGAFARFEKRVMAERKFAENWPRLSGFVKLLRARRAFNSSWQMLQTYRKLKRGHNWLREEWKAQQKIDDAFKRIERTKEGGKAHERALKDFHAAHDLRDQIRALLPYLED